MVYIRNHLFALVAAACAVTALPAQAQTAEPLPGDGTLDVLAGEQEVLSAPVPRDVKPPSFTVQAKFAPVLAGNAPLEDEEQLTDYQTNTLSASVKVPLTAGAAAGLGAAFKAEGGVKHNLDFDDDSTDDNSFKTAVYGNASLEWLRGVRRFSPFVGYGYEKGFAGFLDDDAYVDHKLSFGVRFTTSRYFRPSAPDTTTMSFALVAGAERVWSPTETRERWAPRVAGELSGPLPGGLRWDLTATGERRIFDKIGEHRRLDWFLSTFGGLDFAGLIGDGRVFREAKLGVRWSLNDSNTTGKEFSRLNILPVITIGTSLP